MSKILVAGDWHGNARWAVSVVDRARELGIREILHLGDFGIWPDGNDYLIALHVALDKADVNLRFIDGNHEDHDTLLAWLAASGSEADPVALTSRITWLPRGHRWEQDGRTWLALGGAASVDRAVRIQGKSWWPDEVISDAQEEMVLSDGPADVMITHDCPFGVVHSFDPPPRWWQQEDLDKSDDHRRRLQRIVNKVQPSHLMHGHLHRCYQRTCDFGYGDVQVTGLACDGMDGNCAVLDTVTMELSVIQDPSTVDSMQLAEEEKENP